MRTPCILAACVALLGAGRRVASTDEPATTRDVAGRVVVADVEPASALAGVAVEWFDPSSTGPVPAEQRTATNDLGQYEFKALPARKVRMRYRPNPAGGEGGAVQFAVFEPRDRVCGDDPRCLEWNLGAGGVQDVVLVRVFSKPTDPAAVAGARAAAKQRAEALAAFMRRSAEKAPTETERQAQYAAALDRLHAVDLPASDRLAVTVALWANEKEIPAQSLKAVGIELAASVNTPEQVRGVASLLFETEVAFAATLKDRTSDFAWPTFEDYRTARVDPKTLAHSLEEQLVAHRRRGTDPLGEAELRAVLVKHYGSKNPYLEELWKALPDRLTLPDGAK